MEYLKELYLDETAIKELPSSIENLKALEDLNLKLCKSLDNLPSGISELKSLKKSCRSGCANLQSFPEITTGYLVERYLDGTAIEELSSTIENLTALKVLDLKFVKALNLVLVS